MIESGMFIVRTLGSAAAVCSKRQRFRSLMMSWYTITEAVMISPVRGSSHEGPMAFWNASGA